MTVCKLAFSITSIENGRGAEVTQRGSRLVAPSTNECISTVVLSWEGRHEAPLSRLLYDVPSARGACVEVIKPSWTIWANCSYGARA